MAEITVNLLDYMDKESSLKNYTLEQIKRWLKDRKIQLTKSEIKTFDENEDLTTTEGTQIRRRLTGYNTDGTPKYAVTIVNDGKTIIENVSEWQFLPWQDLKDVGLSKEYIFDTVNVGDTRQSIIGKEQAGRGGLKTLKEIVTWDGTNWVNKDQWDASQVETTEEETTEEETTETETEVDQVDVNQQQLQEQQGDNWVTQEDINQWAESLKTNFGDTTTTNNEQPITPNESLYANRRLTIEDKNRIRFGDAHVDDLKKRNQDFQNMKRGLMTREEFIQTHPNSQTALKARGM